MKNYLRLSPFIHSRTGTALTCTQVILQILRVLDGESINDDSLDIVHKDFERKNIG